MQRVKLKDIVDIFNGSTPSTLDPNNFDGNIPWITPKDLSDQKKKYISNGERDITQKGLASIGNRLLPEGTILFSSRAPIGLMSISANKVSTNQGFKNLVCKNGKVNNEYLYYLLKTKIPKIQEQGTGTTFKEISKNTLDNYEIFIEEHIKIQEQVASVLSALDGKIELNNKINAELEAMAKTLYDYWFVQFDFPNAKGKPYKTSGNKMVYNEQLKKEVPEGWEVKELSNIANITMGQSPPGESYNENGDGVIFYQGCTDFGVRFPTIRKYTTSPTRFAKKGDILLSVRAPVGTLNIAKQDCCIGRGLAALNSKNNAMTFLFGVMLNLKQVFDRRNVDGTTFGSITKDDLFSLPVVVPGDDVLSAFQRIISPAFDKQNLLEEQNQELSSLRDWLLPMLMNGQVTVVEAYKEVEKKLAMVAEEEEVYVKDK